MGDDRLTEDEGRQPELFSLDPPPAPRATCGQCGDSAVVVRFGVAVCTVCRHGVAQAAAAERVAKMNGRTRQARIQQARRRRR